MNGVVLTQTESITVSWRETRLANPTTDGLVMREKAENRSSKRLATVVTVQIPSAGRPSPLDSPPTIDGCLHSEVCTWAFVAVGLVRDKSLGQWNPSVKRPKSCFAWLSWFKVQGASHLSSFISISVCGYYFPAIYSIASRPAHTSGRHSPHDQKEGICDWESERGIS